MMLSPSLCGAVVAVLLLPLLWAVIASALRMLAHSGRDVALSDDVEKLVLTLMLAPCAIGAAAVIAGLIPASPAAPAPLIELPFVEDAASVSSALSHAAPSASFPWLQAAVSAFAWIYGLGAADAALRLVAASLRLRGIEARAEDASQWGKDVVVADTDAPAFVGVRNRIVLPRTLITALTPEQIALVVAHERGHAQRGDALYYALLAWADALFWFNPLLRAQTQRCRLAAELACDVAVTATAPEMRRAYAQALILALKHTAGNPLHCAPAVFSTRLVGEHRMRIREIMQGAQSRRKRSAWAVYVAACLVGAPLATLQIAVAQTDSAAPAALVQTATQSVPAPVVAAAFSVAPIQGPISSKYGPRTNPHGGGQQIHQGVDYIASDGAAIVAPAPGRVTHVQPNRGNAGNVLEIDHGGGLVTQYWHLGGFEVREGQQVAAGQVIARVGDTGLSTGPHLHFMVLRDGQPVDPETVLPRHRAP